MNLSASVDQNGIQQGFSVINNPTLYSSAYLVASRKGYTKHYYIENQRITSKIGQGGLEMVHESPIADETYCMIKSKRLSTSLRNVGACLNSRDLDKEFIEYEDKKGWLVNLYKYKEVLDTEKELFFYHPDHLGSSSWITNAEGKPIQHLAYLPFGEEFVDQRTSDFSAAFKFTGKEKDEETGYNYFGARYYMSDLSIWGSVDPMSDKYPSLSSYNYCANNPIILIDPDGREVVIVGEAATETFKELQSSTKLKLTIDADGKLDATGKIRKKDKLLYEAIKSEDVKVEITTKNANRFQDGENTYATELGGAFMGNSLNRDENGNAVSAKTKQFISMDRVKTCFNAKDVGKLVKHEVTESYMGGRISIERNEAATPAYAPKGGGVSPNTIFQDAHKAATPQPINKPLYLLPKP